MKTKKTKTLMLISVLIAVTCIAMANSKKIKPAIQQTPQTANGKNGIVTLSGALTQDKILSGSDGIVSMALTMTADDVFADTGAADADNLNHVDMVIVLDRSGSMSGEKINTARNAVVELIAKLTASDRFALVTYSDSARIVSRLAHVTPSLKNQLHAMVSGISASGGTNLGQGLQTGIHMLNTVKSDNARRLILISDGLANQGITDIPSLSKMASAAVQNEFSISTAGLGTDYNEALMTAIADHGTGNYYFMENPAAFAAVFNNEFTRTRIAAATSVKISFKEQNGIRLTDAGGYPIENIDRSSVFFPGDLMSGETRKLFLTLQVPTDQISTFTLSDLVLEYHYKNMPWKVKLSTPLHLACVDDPAAAMASIDKDTWARKVIKEDFSRLKEEVAGFIKSGRKSEAMNKIDAYRSKQQELNASVQSDAVTENLDQEVQTLKQTVDESFSGAPAAVAEKQKKNAKILQFESYRERRKN